MRAILPIAALLVAALSVSLDLVPVSPASSLCRYGACRFDQLYSGIDAAGATPEAIAALVNADPANPLVWCVYAEALNKRGDGQKAEAAFDQAMLLGPSMPPVLMRYANFDFAHDRRNHGFLLSARILASTSAFDEILFSYLQQSGAPVSELLRTALPNASRPARSWLAWLCEHGSTRDLTETWTWMQNEGLLDEQSAGEAAWSLWNRGAYRNAHELWCGWLEIYTLLENTRFEKPPKHSPFDWTLGSSSAASVERGNGLEVRFAGTENVAFSQLHQFTVVRPGRYRFSAEIEAEGLTTDQGPYFHIFDPVDPRRLDVATSVILGTAARSWIGTDFMVPEGTDALEVQLERRPSEFFDNRIAGKLHLYQVSLERRDPTR
jgi:hypothetical protein